MRYGPLCVRKKKRVARAPILVPVFASIEYFLGIHIGPLYIMQFSVAKDLTAYTFRTKNIVLTV